MPWQEDDSTEIIIGDTGTTGRIHITSMPTGASITINGELTGRITPQTITGEPGTYEIIMGLDGYQSCSNTITLSAGQNLDVNCNLNPIAPQNGVFIISSTPSGAEIYIDNNYESVTPDSIGLPPATYQIKLKLVGYLDVTDTQTLTSGQTLPLSYTLTEGVQQAGMGWIIGLGLAGAALYEMNKKKRRR